MFKTIFICCRGKFAAVRRCTHKTSGVAYAAKCIRKRRRLQDQRADILHEVAVLLAAASSDRIVRLYEVYETANEMAIVLELYVLCVACIFCHDNFSHTDVLRQGILSSL